MHLTEARAMSYLTDLAKDIHVRFFRNGSLRQGVALADVAGYLRITPLFNFDTKAPNWQPDKAIINRGQAPDESCPIVDIYMHNTRAHWNSQGASYLLRAYAHLYLDSVVQGSQKAALERHFDDLARFGDAESFRDELFTRGFFGFHREFDVPLGQVMAYAAKTLDEFGVATFTNLFHENDLIEALPGSCICGTDAETKLLQMFLEAPVELLRAPHYQAAHNSWKVREVGVPIGYVCATSYVVGEGCMENRRDEKVFVQRTILGGSCCPEYAPLFD